MFEVQQQGRSLARKQQCGRGGRGDRGREGQAAAQGDLDQYLEQMQETNRLLRGYFSLHAAHPERENFTRYLSQGLKEPMSLKSFRIGCCSLGPWSPLLHLAVQLKLQSKLPRATSLHSLYLPHSLSSELNSKVCRASSTLNLHQHLLSPSRPSQTSRLECWSLVKGKASQALPPASSPLHMAPASRAMLNKAAHMAILSSWPLQDRRIAQGSGHITSYHRQYL